MWDACEQTIDSEGTHKEITRRPLRWQNAYTMPDDMGRSSRETSWGEATRGTPGCARRTCYRGTAGNCSPAWLTNGNTVRDIVPELTVFNEKYHLRESRRNKKKWKHEYWKKAEESQKSPSCSNSKCYHIFFFPFVTFRCEKVALVPAKACFPLLTQLTQGVLEGVNQLAFLMENTYIHTFPSDTQANTQLMSSMREIVTVFRQTSPTMLCKISSKLVYLNHQTLWDAISTSKIECLSPEAIKNVLLGKLNIWEE